MRHERTCVFTRLAVGVAGRSVNARGETCKGGERNSVIPIVGYRTASGGLLAQNLHGCDAAMQNLGLSITAGLKPACNFLVRR